ncbi:unnamed protein product [Adineta steineri]|uniref:Tetraspanin n=1 Tax=Adineta steineri TaxID=433720 RepID=A0A818PX01_9BILA|nr:unnamed protein product [Adineta steineri]
MGHGGMSCGMKTMRFVMVAFNIIFFLIGLALIAVGIYVLADPSLQKIKKIFPIDGNPELEQGLSYLTVIAIVILVLGGVLLIIGFLGCCGAMKQVKIFLILYGIITGIIILFEVAITIYFVAFKSKFEDQIKPKLKDALQNTYEGPLGLISNTNVSKPSGISIAWDFIMYNFQCCGVYNRSDFDGTKKWNRTNIWANASLGNSTNFEYPLTCCNMGNVFTTNWNDFNSAQLQSAATCAMTGNNTYTIGCYDKFMDLINTAKTWIIIGAVLILVIELAAFIFAMALCCRKRKDTMYYSN